MKIEAIFRQSTMDDIKKHWELTGRRFNADDDGEMVFENVTNYEVIGDIIMIERGGTDYLYSLSDFYRWKVVR